MSKTYSPAYRAKLVARLRGPDRVTAHMLARETGVTQSTLSRWLREAKERPLLDPTPNPAKRKARKTWTLKEKLRLLSHAEELPQDQLGAYLRKEGVHPDQLRVWQEALEGSGSNRSAERRVKALERELQRKEKALAEAAALLLLKKKAQELGLLGDEEESTDEQNES